MYMYVHYLNNQCRAYYMHVGLHALSKCFIIIIILEVLGPK